MDHTTKSETNEIPTHQEACAKRGVVKLLVAQWDQLDLRNGLLTRRWLSSDNVDVRWLQLIPHLAVVTLSLDSATRG